VIIAVVVAVDVQL